MNSLRRFWKDTTRFLYEVWIEIRPEKGRVAWPTFDTVKISTKVVIFSSIGIGIFIGILDILFGRLLAIIVN